MRWALLLWVSMCGTGRAQGQPQPAPPPHSKKQAPATSSPRTPAAHVKGTVTDPAGAVVPGAKVQVKNVDTQASISVTADERGGYQVSVAAGTYSVEVTANGFKALTHTDVVARANKTVTLASRLEKEAPAPRTPRTPPPPSKPEPGGPPIITTAAVEGTVTDFAGDVVPNAKIQVTNVETQATLSATADTQGRYRVGVPAGTYSVEITVPGFKTVKYADVVARANSAVTLASKLELGEVSEAVTVTAETSLINTSTANIRSVVVSSQIDALELNGRNPVALAALVPGMRADASATSNLTQTGGFAADSGFAAASIPNLDALGEIRIQTGFNAGARNSSETTSTLKEGTHSFHGQAWERWANDHLGARNALDAERKSVLRYNVFGAQLGGPVRPFRKLFFFADYEGARVRNGENFLDAVPSDSARESAVPAVQALIQMYPHGTIATANPDLSIARANLIRRQTQDSGVIRFDWARSDRVRLTWMYGQAKSPDGQPAGVTGNYFLNNPDPREARVRLSTAIRPALMNQLDAKVDNGRLRQRGWSPAPEATTLGVEFFGAPAQSAATGTAPYGGVWRQDGSQVGSGLASTNRSLSVSDEVWWIKGMHTIRGGFQGLWLGMYVDRFVGTFEAFSNIADLIGNRPLFVQSASNLGAGSPRPGSVPGARLAEQQTYAGYIQDDWKVNRRLTATLGLRYEYFSPASEANGQAVTVDAATGAIHNAGAPFYHVSRANLAPRIGLAWSPWRNGKTVFRAGAGYFFDGGRLGDLILPIENDRMVAATAGGATAYQPRAFGSNFQLPSTTLQYSASVQRELPARFVVSGTFTGRRSRGLPLGTWGNRVFAVTTDPATGLGSETRELGTQLAQFDVLSSQGAGQSDSLQGSVEKRGSDLAAGVYWTWSHSIDDAASMVQNPLDFRGERGDSAFDVRQAIAASARYELPLGKRRSGGSMSGRVLKHWIAAGSLSARTGTPIEVTLARPDIVYRDTQTGAISSQPVFDGGRLRTVAVMNVPGGGEYWGTQRPDAVPGVSPFLETGDRRYILNPAAFALPAPGAFGNLGRGVLRGPSFAQIDFRLEKEGHLTEDVRVRFSAGVFNLLNRANYANPPARMQNPLGFQGTGLQPGTPFTSATGGVFGIANSMAVQSLGAGRQMQLELRLIF